MTTSNSERHVVVVGASLAGTRAVEGLRSNGFNGRITLVGAEPELPYDRPPLSKDLFTSDWSDGAISQYQLADQEDFTRLGVDLRLGVKATNLDTEAKIVTLANGSKIDYDDLIIATGAIARPSPWQPESGVFQLRTLEDSRALAARLREGGSVVIVGGGFIGTEIAAAAVGFGCDVTIVDPVPEPMERIVGPEISGHLVRLNGRHGAATRFGVGVDDIVGRDGDLTVKLSDGTEIHTGAAVVGIGSIPCVDWVAESGLIVGNGIVTDEYLRAVGVDNVYVIGDVANWPHEGRGTAIRAEHWTNANDQARFVAAVITAGAGDRYASNDYVWSDQYDWKVHSIGWRDPAGSSTVIGDLDADGKTAVVHVAASGAFAGVVTVNWVQGLNLARRLVMAGSSAEQIITELRAKAEGVPVR
ncbi:MAG: NAD(P)/FAD-dependent oxidoreductase [Gulosibacter sp.]|uniref:NAD(P)/FAD-dependent oxidoreductase n=1 Tax=Gulosibacter sp. TaxID=2817531 RepID=UPI003F8F2481